MNRGIATLVLLVLAAEAYAIPKPKPFPYSARIKTVTIGQKDVPRDSVFIGPAVKAPGGYEFKPGMTIAKLIELAGGLAVGDLNRLKLRSKLFPISIFRPTKTQPDPERPISSCTLDIRKEPAYGLADCTQQIWAGDMIYVVAPSTQPARSWILP